MRTIKTLNREAPRICFHFCPLQRRHIEAPQICFFFRFSDLISDSTAASVIFDYVIFRSKMKKERKRFSLLDLMLKKNEEETRKIKVAERKRETSRRGRERKEKKNERISKKESDP